MAVEKGIELLIEIVWESFLNIEIVTLCVYYIYKKETTIHFVNFTTFIIDNNYYSLLL